jgi:hypothetical protein
VDEKQFKAIARHLLDLLERNTRAITENAEQERFQAVLSAALRLRQLGERAPWAVISPNWIEEIQAAFDPVSAAVEAYLAEEDGEVAFPVTWAEIDRLYASLGPLVTASLPEDSVAEDAATFRRSAGQMIRRLGDDVEAVQQEAKRIRGELSGLEQERSSELAHVKTQQDALEATIAEQANRLEAAIRENQEQFSGAQERNRTEFAQALAEHNKALSAALEVTQTEAARFRQDAATRGQEMVDRLEELEEKALQSYNTIGNASVVGAYQKDANNEERQANRWRWLAVIGFAIVAMGTIIELIASHGRLGWEQTRSRIPIILALGGFATYAVAESSSHRKAGRASRRREVELSSLDPYLILIEDRAEAERVKIEYARRIFVEQGRDPSSEAPQDDDE